MFSRLLIIISILFLLVVPGIATGCNSVTQEGNELFINGQIPPIDRQIPEQTEIATFALG